MWAYLEEAGALIRRQWQAWLGGRTYQNACACMGPARVQLPSVHCLTSHAYACAGAERRITLSSIRAPRVGRRDEKPEPFALEARELLRSILIGEPVYLHSRMHP